MNIFKDRLVKYPSLCGLCAYVILIIFTTLKLQAAAILLALITGGIFSTIIGYSNGQPGNRLSAFIMLSTILYLTCFWIYTSSTSDPYLRIPLASIAGAILLFVVYYWLISKKCPFWIGVTCMFVVGIISTIPYLTMLFFDSHASSDINEVSGLFIFFSIIPVWQILFALTLAKISKNEPIS